MGPSAASGMVANAPPSHHPPPPLTPPADAIAITADGGVKKHILTPGVDEGVPELHSRCFCHYRGYTQDDGEQIVSSCDDGSDEPAHLVAGRTLSDPSGLTVGVASMRRGERAVLYLSPEYGYGERGSFSFPSVPPNAALVYEITLVAWTAADEEKPREEMFFEERLEAALRRKNRGNQLYAQRDFGEACQSYEIALSFVDPEMMFQLHGCHLEETQALRSKIMLNLSGVEIRLGRSRAAMTHADEVLKLEPKNTKALYRAGRARRKLGQCAQAKVMLERAALLEPDDAAIKKELDHIALEERKMRNAQASLYAGKLVPQQNPPAGEREGPGARDGEGNDEGAGSDSGSGAGSDGGPSGEGARARRSGGFLSWAFGKVVGKMM